MYFYISGKIVLIDPKYIVLDNNNIGYTLIVPNPYVFNMDEEVKVYVYQYVRENINDLYGFKTLEEKNLFIKLISVNGIGPKSALSILATGNVEGIVNAIEENNDTYLKRFPGIGNKASLQIILDLKGKINFDQMNSVMKDNPKMEDCKEALIALGYNQKDVSKILLKIDSGLSQSDIIKTALKMITKA